MIVISINCIFGIFGEMCLRGIVDLGNCDCGELSLPGNNCVVLPKLINVLKLICQFFFMSGRDTQLYILKLGIMSYAKTIKYYDTNQSTSICYVFNYNHKYIIVSRELTSILALVHLGTSTTILYTFLASFAYSGMSCNGDTTIPASFSVSQ